MKAWAVILLALSGCSVGQDAGKHADTQAPAQTLANAMPRTTSEPVTPASSQPVIEDVTEHMRSELQQSNNATQNSITGLGVQVAKIAEKVEAALVKMETTVSVSAQMTAETALTVKMRADMRAEMKASAEVNAAAVANVEAHMDAKLNAQAQIQAAAIAGVGNKIDSVAQTYSSGRDTNTTQFTDKMADTIMSGQKFMAYVFVFLVVAIAAIIIAYMEVRHRRGKGIV